MLIAAAVAVVRFLALLLVLIVSWPRGIIAVCPDVEERYRSGREGKEGKERAGG